jgi:hypothetical protein
LVAEISRESGRAFSGVRVLREVKVRFERVGESEWENVGENGRMWESMGESGRVGESRGE